MDVNPFKVPCGGDVVPLRDKTSVAPETLWWSDLSLIMISSKEKKPEWTGEKS
jgi:hypothetical protein